MDSPGLPKLIATAYLPDQLPGIQELCAMFLGRSNVGKSSLINAVCKKTLAKTAKAPGKTRSVNYYAYLPELVLVDLPGFGFAKVSREEQAHWSELVRAFFEKISSRCLAFLLLDSKRDLEETELDLLRALSERRIACRLLLTKSDRLKQAERNERARRLQEVAARNHWEFPLTWTFISAKTGEGVDLLRRLLYRYAKSKEV